MSIIKGSHLRRLLALHQKHVPLLAPWLLEKGISYSLQQRYMISGWLERVGFSAYKVFEDTITWMGAISALQKQAQKTIHIGGSSALSLHGKEHYLRPLSSTQFVFASPLQKLPKWFTEYPWQEEVKLIATNLIEGNEGLVSYRQDTFDVQISSEERAILECLYLSPKFIDLVECYELFEGLVNLRPHIVEALLMQCKSVKVKRLFMYLTKKAGHMWGQYIDLKKVDPGQGTRSFGKGGIYVPEFDIMLPEALVRA